MLRPFARAVPIGGLALAVLTVLLTACATAPAPSLADCEARPYETVSMTMHDRENQSIWLFAARAKVERIRGTMERFGYDIVDTRGGLHHVEYRGPTALPGVVLAASTPGTSSTSAGGPPRPA